jgi:hypothetical protein
MRRVGPKLSQAEEERRRAEAVVRVASAYRSPQATIDDLISATAP